jgi:branched-subunit amino acid aminotransferase/4-amino-4-deoxychorismate lyase
VIEPGRLEIDGREVRAEVAVAVSSGFGHFTAMQVRGGRTRGLELHLARLERANRELFGVGLDGKHVRTLIRHALDGTADASVRVYVFEGHAEPATMVTIKPPGGVSSPLRLRTVRYQRPDAHLKHLATEQGLHTRRTRAEGFDDALLTGDAGVISESATANIGFFDRDGVVWPDAPMLRGITMQLLERQLPGRGEPVRHEPIHVEDVSAFEGAFLSSARGIAVVSAIDDVVLPERAVRMTALVDAYDAVPWDEI